MISPDVALAKILQSVRVLPKMTIPLKDALGFVLAGDVKSKDNLPRFTNSAMDGFAVRTIDCRRASSDSPVKLKVVAVSYAGTRKQPTLANRCAIKVATGAPLPRGSNAVVMQEDCVFQNGFISITEPVPAWDNVRKVGEEIKTGNVALKKGTRLTPGEISWLATMGIRKVQVFRKPRIALLRTGNEVVDTNRKPGPFQIRDAHQLSIKLALKKLDVEVSISPIIKDNPVKVNKVIGRYLKNHDLVLTTGGVSVGERDLLKEGFRNVGVKLHFEKVSQKPGKPMVFGQKVMSYWLGLPGNPVAALVCTYLYVFPFIRGLSGETEMETLWFEAKAATAFPTNSNRTNFLRGKYRDGYVTFAKNQDSQCLGSFSKANVLIKIPPSSTYGKKGETVSFSLLP